MQGMAQHSAYEPPTRDQLQFIAAGTLLAASLAALAVIYVLVWLR